MVAYVATENLVLERQPAIAQVAGEDPNFPRSNVLDGLTWSVAKGVGPGNYIIDLDFGAAVTADCAGVAGHNLHTDPSAGRIRFYYSDDDSTYTLWHDSASGTIPFQGAYFVGNLASESHRYWRLQISHSTLPAEVGVFWLGLATLFPVGVQPGINPPNQNWNNRLLSNFAGGGQILGTSVVEQGGQTSFTFQDIGWGWWEANGVPHYDRMRQGRPFMLTWDNGRKDAAAYCVAPSTPRVVYNSHGRMNLAISALTT